jgi:tetratricopeptide (TPR) repeat protein
MPTVTNGSLSTIKRTIARWENDGVCPGERYQFLLAHVFAEHEGSSLLGPGSDFDQLLTVFAHFGIRPERISELRDVIAATLTRGGNSLLAYLSPTLNTRLTRALSDPSCADVDLAAQLAAAVGDLNSRVGAVPFVRLQVGLVPMAEACRALLHAKLPAKVGQQFLLVATTAYTLAARLAFETHDYASSTDYYSEALSAAGGLPDSWHRAAVRTSQAMVTLYATGDLPRAQAIADEAVRDARKGGSARIRARALALQAEMAARAANTHRAFTALHDAWHEIDHATETDAARDGFDAGRLHGFAGLCHLYAGDAAKAERQFADAARTLNQPRDDVQRGIVRTDQARARIVLDAPEAAAKLLHECIDISASTRGRVPALRVREARLALSPWRGERFVAELDDHMHTNLI